MARGKKETVEYNIWTMPSKEWKQGLKLLRVSKSKLSALKSDRKTIKYNGERLASALQFTSSSQTPTFGNLKKTSIR